MRERTSSRTAVALYVSSPSNPSGRVLPPDWLEALAGFARGQDLWLISDEVYEDFVYRGPGLSLAPERAFAVQVLLEGLRHGGKPHRVRCRPRRGRRRGAQDLDAHGLRRADRRAAGGAAILEGAGERLDRPDARRLQGA